MKKLVIAFTIIISILSSCKFRPFLKYYLPNKTTHLPNFKKWDRFVGSNTNSLRACYDITCYDWKVNVLPIKEEIKSTIKIHFKMTGDQDTLLLDLQSNLKIDAVESDDLKKIKRKRNTLFIIYKRNLKRGEKSILTISYHGKPHVLLGNSTLFWEKDKKNRPWICTSTEGMGPDQLFPCKNLLYDEPDSCFIHTQVPKDLTAVANGKLDSITNSTTTSTYHWSVHNPINIYNISFNVGNYVKIKKDYTDINGIPRVIEAYVLDYNKELGEKYYDQAPLIMKELEKLYGSFPWWNDGCRFIETCLKDGSCMEHQSAISMGDNYAINYMNFNTTLVHELSHEWWGNNLTGYDYADAWLHEGFATYSEALFIEAVFGKQKSANYLNNTSRWVGNIRPIIKTSDVAYKCWVNPKDGDIYGKASLFIHTLRIALNDDPLFFEILKTAQVKFAKSNITTDQFLSFFNEKTGKDFTPYFDLYLKEFTPPTIEFSITQNSDNKKIVNYRWAQELPKGIDLKIIISSGEKYYTLTPSTTFQSLELPLDQKHYFEIMKTGYYLLKDVNN